MTTVGGDKWWIHYFDKTRPRRRPLQSETQDEKPTQNGSNNSR
jgi:hypothetical protein